MPSLLTALGRLVDRIKINAISKEMRDGRPVWIKRRRRTSRPIMACANRFFALAGNPVQALDDLAAWQQWEIGCFRQLHGDGFRAFADGARAVAADEVPGVNLTVPLDDGTLTPRMVAAAARELRRAHGWEGRAFGGAWSHGDPHLGNVVYDAAADRARIIDFEVMHRRHLSAEARHADDLLVFLQDMVGRISAEKWLPIARAFLAAYDRPEIVARLRPQLALPRGVARVWWLVRTTYMHPRELARRLDALREGLA